MLFKTAEIKINYVSISTSTESVSQKAKEGLEDYYNKNLLFISEDKLRAKLEQISPYVEVESIEKKYPNKLVVNVTERVEVLTVKSGDSYYAVDNKFFVLSKKVTNQNNVDGKRNILLNVNIADYDETTLQVGSTFKINEIETQKYLIENLSLITENRQSVLSVDVNVVSDGVKNRTLTVTMLEGLVVQIDKADENTKQKLKKLFEYYQALENKGDTQKRYVTTLTSGEIVVV